MNTKDGLGETRILRANIGIITRGGPVTTLVYQETNPVLLKGMELPAEASYVFLDSTDKRFSNKPISIELFFGDNGQEEEDVSLGEFQLKDIVSALAGSRNIQLRLAVSSAQVLGITVLDRRTQNYRSICFIDISALEPPKIKSHPKLSAARQSELFSQQMSVLAARKPREAGNPHRGKDLAQDLTIALEEALHGAQKAIEVVGTETCLVCTGSGTAPGKTLVHCADCVGTGWKKEKKQPEKGRRWQFTTCPTCNGDGLVNAYPCRNCRGTGSVKIKRPIMLQIPSCIDSGAEICILHQGEPGQYGGLPGHLRITVKIAAHPLLTRTGRDISIILPVSASFSKEGGRLRVPLVEKGSSALVNLPAGAKNGTIFQVTENEAYTLTAHIETYRPAFLFLLPEIKKHLQAIQEALGDAEYELPGPLDNGDTSRIPATDGQPVKEKSPGGTAPTIGRSTTQAEFYTRRGSLYAEQRNVERALADFNTALELDPNDASAYDNRSGVYLGQNEPGKALADLNKALELAPDNAEYHLHRGMMYHAQNDLTLALANYNKALELDPLNSDIYECRGKLHSIQKDLEATLADFNRVLELDPSNAEIYHQRGVLYKHKNDLAKTIADFSKALELDPDNDTVRSDRLQVYIFNNDLENALADADTLVEQLPHNARAYNTRGCVYFLRDNLDKALSDYSKALELNFKFVEAYNNRGKTYLKQNQYKQAAEDFNKSLSLHPGDAHLYLWLGQAYQGLGEKDKAIACCQKVLGASQDHELRRKAQKLMMDLGLK